MAGSGQCAINDSAAMLLRKAKDRLLARSWKEVLKSLQSKGGPSCQGKPSDSQSLNAHKASVTKHLSQSELFRRCTCISMKRNNLQRVLAESPPCIPILSVISMSVDVIGIACNSRASCFESVAWPCQNRLTYFLLPAKFELCSLVRRSVNTCKT